MLSGARTVDGGKEHLVQVVGVLEIPQHLPAELSLQSANLRAAHSSAASERVATHCLVKRLRLSGRRESSPPLGHGWASSWGCCWRNRLPGLSGARGDETALDTSLVTGMARDGQAEIAVYI